MVIFAFVVAINREIHWQMRNSIDQYSIEKSETPPKNGPSETKGMRRAWCSDLCNFPNKFTGFVEHASVINAGNFFLCRHSEFAGKRRKTSTRGPTVLYQASKSECLAIFLLARDFAFIFSNAIIPRWSLAEQFSLQTVSFHWALAYSLALCRSIKFHVRHK